MTASFEEAFRAEFPALHRFLYRRLGAEAADDVAAETFAIAYTRWGSYDATRPVRPWLYGIASNLVRHRWRSERRQLAAYARTGIDPIQTIWTKRIAESTRLRGSASSLRRSRISATATATSSCSTPGPS